MKSSIYKTKEQVEFTDLMNELIKNFGYNQARIAEVAQVKPPMVSQIKKGKWSPGPPSLELLRRELEWLTNPKTAPPPRNLVREQLDYLETNDPGAFEAAKATIGALHKRAIKGVSSKVASVAAESRDAAEALAHELDQESSPSSKAGETSARKPSRARDTGKPSSKPPFPQGPAPT